MDTLLAAVLIFISFSLFWIYKSIEEVVVTDPFITEDSERELWRINIVTAIVGSSCTTGATWMLIKIFMEIYHI